MELTFRPLTPENWQDLVALFEEHSVTKGCCCTYFRQTRKDYHANFGTKNRSLMKSIVEGYPVIPKSAKDANTDLFTGILSTFEEAGFKEVARRSDQRPVLRYIVPL